MNRLNRALVLLVVLTLLSGCNSNVDNSSGDLFNYKDSYLGDNSAVVNTVIYLKGADYFRGIELQTKEQPYGIIVDYDWSESVIDLQETVINNASYLFTLIQNVDWIMLKFETVDGVEEFKLTREELEGWYEVNLSKIESEEKLKELIQVHLKNSEEVTKLLK
ncbi:hypothetical protein B481_0626 [Planococcus halocryophilus Or1]|uniref:DUF4825 domain-containing protein n=1 Tax=Planococcus halocryophilus TaxID=1215089 RepID=A0A1C7DV36_9BACL|nr:DUF4825 domain-containing protein [Planococcus halocryophilus]ANU15272.1 DUF4825 domain-containing protein [Planococcus halocryophilus]EMF47624.1 hypothetical protein B481_0626 [Planococcus halocryophilus Or1]